MPGSLEYKSSSTARASSRLLEVEKCLYEGSSRSESCLNEVEVSERAQGLRISRGSDIVCVLFCVSTHTEDECSNEISSVCS